MADRAIQIEGLDDLRKNLRRLKDKGLNDEMKAIHLALADEITKKALPAVPVLTGRLKASVRAAGTVRDAIGRVGKASVPYAAAIHWGWPSRGMPARPFLTDAAEDIERDVAERYERQVAALFDRTIGR